MGEGIAKHNISVYLPSSWVEGPLFHTIQENDYKNARYHIIIHRFLCEKKWIFANGLHVLCRVKYGLTDIAIFGRSPARRFLTFLKGPL